MTEGELKSPKDHIFWKKHFFRGSGVQNHSERRPGVVQCKSFAKHFFYLACSRPESWTVDPKVKKAHHQVSYVWPARRTPKHSVWDINMATFYEKCQNRSNSIQKIAVNGSEGSFLLIFSARDDLVKLSWKSDTWKCQHQLTRISIVLASEVFDCSYKQNTNAYLVASTLTIQ